MTTYLCNFKMLISNLKVLIGFNIKMELKGHGINEMIPKICSTQEHIICRDSQIKTESLITRY